MPRVRCFCEGCVYWEQGYCVADEIELDIQDGCLQFIQMENMPEDEAWEALFDDEEGFFDEDDDEDDYNPDEWN